MPKVTIATSVNTGSPSMYDQYWGGYQIVYSGITRISSTTTGENLIDPGNWMLKFSTLGDIISSLLKNPKDDKAYEDLIKFLKDNYDKG